MTSIIEPPPPAAPANTPRPEERLVDERIRQTRRSLKWIDFYSGLLTLIIGVLVFLLTMSVLDHWVIPGGWNGPSRLALLIAMLLGITWYSWRTFWPLLSRPINPAYAAQLIERSSPSLKNSLLNFLLLRNRRQQLSQKVYQAIEHQAAQRLSEVSLDSVIDRSSLLRLGYVLVAVVAVCALYRVLSPKNLTASMERVLMPWSNIPVPSRVEILDVSPGDTEIARGEFLEVSAEVLGLRTDEQVRVRYSTLDGQTVDREVTLNASEGSSRYLGRLPDRFSTDSGGVQQDLQYWIEAGDAKSKKYRVTVFARPTLVVEKIRYQFPDYTGLPPREMEGTGDISALEGTKVSIYALANHEIASANLDFGADGRNDLSMSTEKERASVQFELALQEDRRTPEHDSYVLQYKTTSGRLSSLPPKYSIDVTPDYGPEVQILKPVDEEGKLVEQLDVVFDSPFTVEVEARDPDFALKNVVLIGELAGEQVLKHDLLSQDHAGKFVGQFTATPTDLKLKPGDILEYHAAAIDNRQPEPNIATTEKLRIRVLGPPEFGGQQGQGQGQGSQGGDGDESSEGGHGEDGEQGQQGGGGEGESGQQQGGDQAGGEQAGQGESQGEQQGQGAKGGNQGQNGDQQGGQPASGGGEQQSEQQGDPASAGGESSGQGEGEQQEGSNSAGGENAGQGQPQEGQGKVAADGSDDAEAFDRMTEHFSEKEGSADGEQMGGDSPKSDSNQRDQGQSAQGDSETDQSESGGETQSSKGEGSESNEPSQGEAGHNQDQGIEGAQEGEQSEGSGAEGQPNEQRPDEPVPGEPASAGGEKDPQEQESPGGKMSSEQGDQGAGNNPGENEGSMDTDAGRKPREKEAEGPDSTMDDQQPGGQGNHQKESDSQGSTAGDQTGGGQQGAGQQADAEGTGTAGENTAADDGAGQAQQSGTGENSSQAGQQGKSDKPTGESSEDQAGPGGEPASSGGENAGGEQPGGDQPGGDQDGENGEQPQRSQDSQPSGQPGQGPPSGGTGNNNSSPPPPGEMAPGDEANLDYARKQTDLVLDRLEEQLKNNEVNDDLLKKLGWTKEELQKFVDRWKALKAEADAEPAQQGETELDKALRSLGLSPNRRTGFQAQVTKERLRQLQDSYRGQVPLEYAEQVRAYIKGTATAPEERD